MKRKLLLAFLILAPVLLIQLPAINRPIFGHFASYQGTVMGGIAQNMVREHFSELLLPKTNLIFGTGRSLHLNQYPLPSLLAALGNSFAGGTMEFWGRLQAIIFNLITIALMGLIARRLWAGMGWQTAALFAFSPFSLIYGQSFLSEAAGLCFLMAALYLLLASETSRQKLILTICSALLFSLAITSRIHFAVTYFIFFYCLITSEKRSWAQWMIFSFLGFLLPTAWYAHTYFTGLSSDHLHTNFFVQMFSPGDVAKGQIFTNLDYYKRLFDLISLNVLTPMLFPFFLIGLFIMPFKERSSRIVYLGVAMGLLLIVLAPQKLLEHDFYLYGVFPFLMLAASFGLQHLWKGFEANRLKWAVFVFFFLYLVVSARYFVNPLFKYPSEAHRVVSLGQKIQQLTGPDEEISMVGPFAPELAFYTNRPVRMLDFTKLGQGIPAFMKNSRFSRVNLDYVAKFEAAMTDPITWVEFFRTEGSFYLVSTNKETIDQIPGLLAHLKQNDEELSTAEDDYYLFRLNAHV